MTTPDSTAVLQIETAAYGDPDARELTAQVQAEYVVRYGGPDDTPVADADFSAPNGIFLIGYVDGAPVAMGGWRRADDETVELKRMYVAPPARRRGFSRVMLAELERRAAQAGFRRIILETGLAQPEAIALYRSCGYTAVEPFGHYAQAQDSVHLGRRLED